MSLSFGTALNILRDAKWDRAPAGAAVLCCCSRTLSEDVMRAMKYVPGESLFYTLLKSENPKEEYGNWPSEHFAKSGASMPPNESIQWRIVGLNELKLLANLEVPFPDYKKLQDVEVANVYRRLEVGSMPTKPQGLEPK